MADRIFEGTVEVPFKIVVHDQRVIDRPVNNVDGWRDQLYDLQTENEVIEHLAFNAVANSVDDITRLDGWADLDPSAATITVGRNLDYWIDEVTGG